MRIRIHNGHIIDPANGIDADGDICIDDGKIISVLDCPSDFSADLKIDAAGKLVIPGLIDLCARFREPGQENKATIASESVAAAAAGITTVCYPPDTDPVMDTSAVVELVHQRVASVNKTRVYPIGAMTYALEGKRLAEMQTLKRAGCIAVSNANRPISDTEVLRRALEYAANFDLTVFLYAEDYYLRNDGVAHEGVISTHLGLAPIPVTAETVAVSRALLLVEQTGVKLHFCRLSSAKSVAIVAAAKQSGLPVSADVSICHLHLTESDLKNYNANCHLNPPLRSEQDKDALIQGIATGTIDAICSDHQPHDDDAKAAPFGETEPGASTIDLLIPLIISLTDNKQLSLEKIIASLTLNPAKILGINSGTLNIGTTADIAVIDTKQTWTVDKNNLLSAGKNTPFDGWKLAGKVTHTLLEGRVVHELSQ